MGSEHVLRLSEIHSIYKIIYHFIRSISRPQFFVGPACTGDHVQLTSQSQNRIRNSPHGDERDRDHMIAGDSPN